MKLVEFENGAKLPLPIVTVIKMALDELHSPSQEGNLANMLNSALAGYDVIKTAYEPKYASQISEKQKQTLTSLALMENGIIRQEVLEVARNFYKISDDERGVVGIQPKFRIIESPKDPQP